MFFTVKKRSQSSSRVVWDELSREQSCKKIPLQAPKKRGVEPISRQPQNFSCSQAPKTDRKAQVGCFEMNVAREQSCKKIPVQAPKKRGVQPISWLSQDYSCFGALRNPVAKLDYGVLGWTLLVSNHAKRDTFTSSSRNRELNPYLGCPKTFHVPNRQKPIAMLKSGGLRWTFSSAIMQKDTFTSPQETGSWTHISAAPKLFMFPSAKNPLQSSSRVFWDERCSWAIMQKGTSTSPQETRSWTHILAVPRLLIFFERQNPIAKLKSGGLRWTLLVSNHAKRYLYKPSSRNGELNPYLGSPKTYHVPKRQKPIAKLKSGVLRWTCSWAIVQKDTFTSPQETGS